MPDATLPRGGSKVTDGLIRLVAALDQVIIVLGSVTQVLVGMRSKPPTKRGVAKILLSWSLPLNLGALEKLFLCRTSSVRGGAAKVQIAL